MATRFLLPWEQVFTDAGDPISGALLDFYATGTSTRKNTYSDAGLTVANSNPVVADAAGRFSDIFLASGDYKVVLRLADGSTVRTADPVAGAASAVGASGTTKNLLINGDFRINQRGFTTGSDDVYGLDRWYSLTQSNDIGLARQTFSGSAQYHYMRMTQANATAQRFGSAQIVEAEDCAHLAGQGSVTLSGQLRFSVAAPVRYAVLAWTGTADTVTSDVVLDWTSASYVAGGFFLAANLSVVGISSITPQAAIWTPFTVTGAVPAGTTNLIVVAWTEGTAAQNVTLDLGLMQLESGEDASAFERRPFAQELALCMRFFETSSPSLVDNGGAWTENSGVSSGMSHPTALYRQQTMFRAKKRVAPSIITIDRAGTTNKISYFSGSWNNAAAFSVFGYSALGFYAGHDIALATETQFVWRADAEL